MMCKKSLLIAFIGLLCSPFAHSETLKSSYKKEKTSSARIPVILTAWKAKFRQPTGVYPVPSSSKFVVIEKGGVAYLTDQKTKKELFKVRVKTRSELGLLGLAFDPEFAKNRFFYVNYNPYIGETRTRVEKWLWPVKGAPKAKQVILEVEQPYSNHNAGELQFGPDGYLYCGFGDGGSGGDPLQQGQNKKTFLGSIIRIDVRGKSKYGAYSIPSDNPFLKSQRPEVFAYGLRNPWRFSFDQKGRLVVADVGQNAWEEVSFATKGSNLGWKVYEASHCFRAKKCEAPENYQPPFVEYDRSFGASITGGYEFLDRADRKLRGHYIFGDFVSGQLLAVTLPENSKTNGLVKFKDLGRFEMSLSSFGRDNSGRVYAVSYDSGKIYQIQSQ